VTTRSKLESLQGAPLASPSDLEPEAVKDITGGAQCLACGRIRSLCPDKELSALEENL
jgi:hypothetical protein